VSRAKEFEQRLERTEQQLRLLQKISRCMARPMPLQQALDDVVALVTEFMECDSSLLYLLDNNELVLRATNNPHPAAVGRVRLALSEGLTGWVAREKRLLAISREAYHDSRFKFFSDLPEDTYEAFLSAPIMSPYWHGNGTANHRRRASGLPTHAFQDGDEDAQRDGGSGLVLGYGT
jgi:transcriptional regulator with GAF, ATPase, and Fis domain